MPRRTSPVHSIALVLAVLGYVFGILCLLNRDDGAGAAWMISTAIIVGAIIIRRGLPSKDE